MKENELKAQKAKLSFYENNNCIWGQVINRTLKQAEGTIGECRYMGISTEVNGNIIQIAQGIWNKDETIKIKNRVVDNNPNISDYFENNMGDISIFSFNCDKNVFEYLVSKNVFIQNKNKLGKSVYYLPYPLLFGEDSPVVEIAADVFSSIKNNYVKINMQVCKLSQTAI